MAVQVSWYMGRRIIYALIQSEYLSLAELEALNDQLLPFIRHSDPYAHVILDASSVTTMQSQVFERATLSYLREPDLGRTIVIASDAVAAQFRPLFARSAPFDSFTSLEEGMFFLEDEDESLLMPT